MSSIVSPLRRLAAVIFDLDGTLVDSEPLHLVATNRVLAEFGAGLTALENAQYIGMSEEEYWTDLRSRFGIGLPVATLGERRVAAFEEVVQTEKPPIAAGIFEFMGQLRNADVPMAVASSSPRRVVDRLLDLAGLSQFVPVRAGGDEVPRAKPDPAVYRLAAERLGSGSTGVVAFEDSARGVAAARSAGLWVVGVSGVTPRADALPGVVATIRDFHDLKLATVTEWVLAAAGTGREGRR